MTDLNLTVLNATHTWKDGTSQLFTLPYVSLSVIPLHLSHILLVLSKRKLHQNVYYILVNLSISDMILATIVMLGNLFQNDKLLASTAAGAFYTSSVIFTLAMTLDRYIKVEYGLRYHTLVTKKRLALVLALVWGFSILLPTLPAHITKDQLIHMFTVGVFCVLCAIILICTSLWVHRLRNKHLEEIKKRNVYFGIHGEEFNSLKQLKVAVKEIIQLNVVTAVLIIVGCLLHVLRKTIVKEPWFLMTSACMMQMYIISNPFVYLFVMGDIRRYYFQYFRRVRTILCTRTNRVGISVA